MISEINRAKEKIEEARENIERNFNNCLWIGKYSGHQLREKQDISNIKNNVCIEKIENLIEQISQYNREDICQ
jgi:hypothetical protein